MERLSPQNQSQTAELKNLLTARFEQTMTVSENFFKAESERVARACREMARRFQLGGRLLAFGAGPAASDAQHVAVEFVHPVTVGRRAFSGLALSEENLTRARAGSSAQTGPINGFAHRLAVLGCPSDIAIGLATGPDGEPDILEALQEAHRRGLLTLAFSGGESKLPKENFIDFCFVVPTNDPWAVQETHRTLYHILWELVHVYFEHEGLLEA